MNVSLLRIAGWVLVWASVFVLPVTAWAQAGDEPFRRGLTARGDRKWSEMAEAMRQAIALDRTESMRKVRSGFLRSAATEYVPYFFLGEALKNQGDCQGAVTAWESSEDQKVVLSLPEFAGLLRGGYKECAAKGVLLREDYLRQINAADQVYNDALGIATRLDRVRASSPDLWKSDLDAELERARNDLGVAQKGLLKARTTRMLADFNESRNASARAAGVLRPLETRLGAAINARTVIGEQAAETQQILTGIETTERAIDAAKVALPADLAASRESARALVRGSRERLAVAEKTQNATAAGEALRQAQEASDALSKVLEQLSKLARGEFEQRFQQVVAAATEQLSFVATSFATLERLIAEKPGAMTSAMSGEHESLQKSRSSLQRRFDNSRRTENVAGVEETMRLAIEARTRIDALIKMFGPATLRDRGVHPALEEGARLFFEGEYQQVLSALDPLGSAVDVHLQVHVHLFRAASLYALYLRSGETKQALRTSALAEIQRCKEIEPAFQPSARAFSPRFLSFFQTAGAPGAQPAATPATQ
jgi:hypothetical protein